MTATGYSRQSSVSRHWPLSEVKRSYPVRRVDSAPGDPLQILRPSGRLAGGAGPHAWADLFAVMKCEDNVRMPVPAEDAMGAGLFRNTPSDPDQRREDP
jgi:hypothetical protein